MSTTALHDHEYFIEPNVDFSFLKEIHNKCYQKLHIKLIICLIIVRVCGKSFFKIPFCLSIESIRHGSTLSRNMFNGILSLIATNTYILRLTHIILMRTEEIVKKIKIEFDMISLIFFPSFTCKFVFGNTSVMLVFI